MSLTVTVRSTLEEKARAWDRGTGHPGVHEGILGM